MFLGPRSFIVHVLPEQLAEAKAWYASVVGKTPYFEEPFYVGFNVGDFELGIDPNGGQPGPGGAIAYWGVDNVEAEVKRLSALGASMVKPMLDVGGGNKVAVVANPFGNTFGVIENPHFDRNAVA